MSKFKQLVPYLAIIVLSSILLGGIFEQGYLVRSDNSTHLLRAIMLKDNILAGDFTSWNYNDNLGSPFLTYTYILMYIIIALISTITTLSVSLTYKLTLFLTFILIPSLLYFFLSKNFKKLPSFSVSLLFIFHVATIQQFLEGMWGQYLAIVFLLIFFYYLHKNSRKLTYKNIGILSILLSLTILAHPYVGLSTLYLFGLYFILIIKNKLKSLLIPILSLLMSSFYLLPIISTNSWAVSNIGWGISSNFFEAIYKSFGILFSLQSLKTFTLENLILTIPNLILTILALMLKISFLFLIISFIIGTGFWFNFYIFDLLPLKNILSSRFLIIAKLPLFIFATFALSKIRLNKTIFYLSIILLLISSITLFQPDKDLLRTSENSPELNDYFKTIGYLQALDLTNTRIVFQSTYKVTNEGIYTPLVLAPHTLQTPVIGSWSDPIFQISESLDATRSRLFNTKNIPEEKLIENMELYNAKYLVLTENLELKNFTKLTSNKFIIYELENFNSDWVETNANYEIKQLKPPTIEIEAENETKILIKMAYHPFWKAYINAKEVEINNNNYLMEINLEKGIYILELKYNPIKRLYILLSLMGLLSALYAGYSRIR